MSTTRDDQRPLTPEERRKLVEAPLPSQRGWGVNVIPSNCRYGGGSGSTPVLGRFGRVTAHRHAPLIPEIEALHRDNQ